MIFDRYDPNAARLRPTINEVMPSSMERMGLAFEFTSRGDSHMARSRGLSDVFDTIISSINEDVGPIEFRDIGGERVPSRITINPAMFLNEVSLLGTFGERQYRYAGQQLFDNVLAYEEANPGSISPEILNLMSFDAVEQRMTESAIALRQEFESVAALPGGSFVEFVGQFAGGMQDIAEDPLQAASMFVGGAGVKTLYAFTFREALIGAGFEAARQPQLAEWYNRLGIEYSSEDFFRNVGFGAAAGAGFAVGAEAIGMGLRRVFGGGQRPPGGAVGGQPTSNPDLLNLLSTQQLREGVEAMRAAGVTFNSEASAAFTLAQRIEETQSFNFGLPPGEYARNINLAELSVAEGRIPMDLLDNTPSVLTRQALLAAQPEMENLGGVLYAFDPRDILVDARTFQFKGGGDEFGVTDRLQFITEWDPQLAGVVTVYEYADGRLFIADGHQRVGLARRLMAENPELKIQLYGYRLREVDGITPEQAMISAAVTNIAQGTGSVIDAAKIARMDPERFRGMVGRTLPPTSQLVRQAQDMMGLTQDAFGAVINDVIPSNYGAIVGRLLADRPELQQAAIGVLARAEPANAFQAEAIVRQVREADTDVATQQSLFGEEMIVESLYTERARVLDRAVKTLRQDRAAFANLVRNAENIESAGNVLDRSVNQRRADLDGQAIALVQTLANRKGPLSDALSDAARLARDSSSYATPTRQFVESIRRAIADGDFERLTSGEVGRIVNDTPPSRRSEVGQEPSLAGFDEPTGHGAAVEQQADDLTREMFPEPEPAPPATRAQEPAEELDARSPIEEDRVPLEEIRMPVDDTLPLDQIRAQVRALTQENIPIVRDLMQRIDERFGTRSGDSVKDLSKVTQKANRPSIIAKKPWHRVSHIRDSYRFKTVIDDIRDVPAIFDELLASGIQLVKVDTGKLFSPKEWGWRIIAFDLRMPNGQLVEWYLPIRELEAQKKAEGHLLFEEWRNKSAEDINVEMDAYMATIQRSFEGYDKAFQASLDRMGISREEASASWTSAESSMLDAARKSPSSSGMITSSGERVLDIQDPSRVRMAQEPDGKNIITREVPSSIRAEEGVSTGAAPMFEMTGAGEQTLIPGVEPISDIGLAQAQMQRPLRGGQAALPEGGLFDETARAQQDLFADVNLDEEIPISAIVDPETGEVMAQTMTMRDLKQMLDEEDSFMDRLGYCTR